MLSLFHIVYAIQMEKLNCASSANRTIMSSHCRFRQFRTLKLQEKHGNLSNIRGAMGHTSVCTNSILAADVYGVVRYSFGAQG